MTFPASIRFPSVCAAAILVMTASTATHAAAPVTLKIATIAPAKTLSTEVQPNSLPTMYPSPSIMLVSNRAAIPEVAAT